MLQSTIDHISQFHPKAREPFTNFINDAEKALGITLVIVQGLRTFAQQQAIYEQGRTTPGPIVTHAKAGQSWHCYGLAVDACPYKADGKTLDWNYDFKKLEPFALKYSINWGGHFSSPDDDHFEIKFGHIWQELYAKYEAKDFIPGTHYVNL